MSWHFDEALLEPVARWWRFTVGFRCIPHRRSLILADLGCGPEIRFFHYCQKHRLGFKQYIGIDPLISSTKKIRLERDQRVKIITRPLVKKINLPTQSVDVVTGFAFLEHIDHPQEILRDSLRILKPGGILILTTPTPPAKTVLEFLAYQLRLISQREIREHKNYFNRETLLKLLSSHGANYQIRHTYFERGLNNLLIIKKRPTKVD